MTNKVYSHAMVEIHCVINGTVQNVRYRDYVQTSAMTLELVGWVRNMQNGTVEVVAQGSPEVLKEFVEYLHEGSLLSCVEAVSVDWGTVKRPHDEFSIIH